MLVYKVIIETFVNLNLDIFPGQTMITAVNFSYLSKLNSQIEIEILVIIF